MTAHAFLPLYALLLLLAGCATRISEPVSVGRGVYTMAGAAFGLTTTSSDVVSDVERRASGFCASSGGSTLEVVKVDITPAERVRFPEGRLQFRCVTQAPNAVTSTGSGKTLF